MLTNATVYLFDIDSVQDPINGDRVRSIAGYKKVLGELSEVGVSTFWNAHSNQVALVATVQIQKQAYKNNKFIYLKRYGIGHVYEINNAAKGESAEKVRLNLTETTEIGLKEMIEIGIS